MRGAQRFLAWIGIGAVLIAASTRGEEGARSIEFTTDEGTWLSLDVSPDGSTIVFELLGDVYAMPAAGGEARPLLTGRAFQSQPRYSPDGASLAFVSDASGSDNLWIANSGGGFARPLTSLPRALMLSPDWSIAGDAVFVTVIDDSVRAAEIWRFDLAGGPGERIVENRNGPAAPLISSPAPGAYGPALAPDGLGLLYTSVTPRPYGSRSGAVSVVMRRDLATGREEALTLTGVNPMKPGVTPDGRRLVYASTIDGRTVLRSRDLASGEDRALGPPIQRHQLEGRATRDVLPNFAVAPDGESVLAAYGGKIHRLSLRERTDELIPFRARVSLEVNPVLDFPRRVDAGPVVARRIRHLDIAKDGRAAFTALSSVYATLAGGGEPVRLTGSVRPREAMPAFSPDGVWVAYVTWGVDGGHLWKVRADGHGEPVRLSEKPALWLDPAWTPDGSAIVAVTAPLGSTLASPAVSPPDARLVELPADGGATRTIAREPGVRAPHFAGDDARIWLTAGGALVSIARDGTDRRVQAQLSRTAGPAEWRVSPQGDAALALVGGTLLRFPVTLPATGELAIDDGLLFTAGGPTTFAWSDDGESVAWVIGNVLYAASARSGQAAVRRLSVSAARPRPNGTVVLRGARAITMRGEEIVEDADVVVAGDRIESVGRRGERAIPADARVLDVTGKVVVPGFIDVHAHFLASDDLPQPESSWSYANLAFGVTSLRNPQAPPDIFTIADIVEAHGVAGPRVFSTGPGVALGMRAGHYLAPPWSSADAVRETLARYPEEFGTHLLKSYLVGNRQERQWIVEASRELRLMPTTEGAADTKADLTHAIDGFSGLEHAFPVAPIHDDIVQLMARTGITYTPTLVVAFGGALPIYRLLAQERPHENPRLSRWFPEGQLYSATSSRLLWFPPEDFNDPAAAAGAAKIVRAGGQVAVGGHGEVQGLSFHWEMELLANGGMPPHDVLRSATLRGAEAIGYGQDLGSLEPGKLADLVVLDRDPLAGIRNTTAIRWVMKGGVLRDAATLDEIWPARRPLERPWWLPAEGAAMNRVPGSGTRSESP